MIGVVDSGADKLDSLLEALENTEDTIVAPPAGLQTADPRVIIAHGEDALIELIQTDISIPVLPIAAGPGIGSIPPTEIDSIITQLNTNDYDIRSNPLLQIAIDDDPVGRALFDVMLVTADPGQISEYQVSTQEPIAEFRADGVVAATPAGSYRYANAAGSPILSPRLPAVAVVPIAAFAIRVDHWVFDLASPLTFTVQRDQADITLLLDGHEATKIPANVPISIKNPRSFDTILLSTPSEARLEKL